MARVFQTTKTLTFRECDPAGIMFFGNIFGIAHDAFEEFIVEAGYQYNEWFKQSHFIIPIRHTECDYLAPFRAGQSYDITVSVSSFGTSSFRMKYQFSQNGKPHAVVQMVHSVLEYPSFKKIPLPEMIQSRLAPYLENN